MISKIKYSAHVFLALYYKKRESERIDMKMS